jgi:hypothetical protein
MSTFRMNTSPPFSGWISRSAYRLLLLVSYSAYSSILMMEAIWSSEKLGNLRTTQRYNPANRTLHRTWNSLSLSLSFYSPLDLGRFFQFLNPIQSVGLLGRGISQSQRRYLHTGQQKHRIKAYRYPRFEWDSNPRPVYERAKTVRGSDRAATVIGVPEIIPCGLFPLSRNEGNEVKKGRWLEGVPVLQC